MINPNLPHIYDRIKGISLSDLPDKVLPGRYLIDGEYIFPDRSGLIALPNVRDHIQRTGFPDQLPDGMSRGNLIVFADNFDLLNGAKWEEWINQTPFTLTQDFTGTEKTPFDNHLDQYSKHVGVICKDPITHLIVETQRVPVHRVRRIPNNAFSYLASHSEDWDVRKLNTVQPRRVLSTVLDDLYNIYENRLTVRLIDETERYLHERLNKARKLDKEKERENERLGIQTRNHRVYHLLGRVFDDDEFGNLKSLIKWYENKLRIYRQFEKSLLYRSISYTARHQVMNVVHTTNILANDHHYRYINVLWKSYLTERGNQNTDELNLHENLNRQAQGLETLTLVMVIHALEGLKFRPTSSDPIYRGATQFLRHDGFEDLSVTWNADRTFTIKSKSKPVLRIIPLLAALTQRDLHIQEAVDQIVQVARNNADGVDFAVVYPALSEERQKLVYAQSYAVNSPSYLLKERKQLSIIPISGYELDSTERIGRMIRWVIWSRLYQDYPCIINVSAEVATFMTNMASKLIHHPKIITSGGKRQAVFYDPTFDRESLLRLLDTKINALRTGDPQIRFQTDTFQSFRQYVEFCADHLVKLTICPVCGNKSDYIGSGFELDRFKCQCTSCNVTWGLNKCGNCGEKYPFLDHGIPIKPDNLSSSDWIEHQYGMDILATPCQSDSSRFVCPYCNDCPNRATQGKECRYCTAHTTPLKPNNSNMG